MVTPADPPLVVVAGPTGSGKSELALRVAEEFGGEVVNCDSLQIYRYFDIGTAKLPESERRGIPHHLIDIVDPTPKTIDSLQRIELPAGVDIEIKIQSA